jgi:hypothetical protein
MSQGITRRNFIKLFSAGAGSFLLTPAGLIPIPE